MELDSGKLFFLSLVGAGGFLYWYKRKQANALAAQAADHAKQVVGTLRVPRPDFVMTIPRTEVELDTIDAHLCECVSGVDLDAAPDSLVSSLQMCLATRLYPDFPWPPAPGDHESAMQLWLLLEYRIRSLANTSDLVRLCAPKPSIEPQIPLPKPEPTVPGPGLHIPAQTH